MSSYTFQATKVSQQMTGSKRKKLFVSVHSGESSKVNTASYWDGGSKSVYHLWKFREGNKNLSYCPLGSYPDFRAETEIVPGHVLIVTGTSCGKPAFPRFICLEQDFEDLKTVLGV